MKKQIFIFIILVVSSVAVVAQNRTLFCDSLFIDICPIPDNHTDSLFVFRNQLHIKAKISINSLNLPDTVNFSVSPLFPIPDFSVRNLNSYAVFENDTTSISNQINNPDLISVINTLPKASLIIDYDIIGLYGFYPPLMMDSLFVNTNDKLIINVFQSEIENLIIRNENMAFGKIIVTSSAGNWAYFPYIDVDHSIKNANNLKRYSIISIDTAAIGMYKQNLNKFSYTLYAIDKNYIDTFYINKPLYEKGLLKITNDYHSPINDFSIISTFFRDNENRNAYGKAYGNYFFCDETFLSKPQTLFHESIHVLYPIQLNEQEGNRFFIGESMVEWVSQYLMYGKFSPSKRKIEIPSEQNFCNINMNFGQTWNLIYLLGPLILQNLADETSPEQLYNAIMQFYTSKVNIEKTYKDFLIFLGKENFTKSALTELDNAICGQYSNSIKNKMEMYNILLTN